jgi:hypothetical protein
VWRSIFSSAPILPSSLLRGIARDAGAIDFVAYNGDMLNDFMQINQVFRRAARRGLLFRMCAGISRSLPTRREWISGFPATRTGSSSSRLQRIKTPALLGIK